MNDGSLHFVSTKESLSTLKVPTLKDTLLRGNNQKISDKKSELVKNNL